MTGKNLTQSNKELYNITLLFSAPSILCPFLHHKCRRKGEALENVIDRNGCCSPVHDRYTHSIEPKRKKNVRFYIYTIKTASFTVSKRILFFYSLFLSFFYPCGEKLTSPAADCVVMLTECMSIYSIFYIGYTQLFTSGNCSLVMTVNSNK